MPKLRGLLQTLVTIVVLCGATVAAESGRWSEQRIRDWERRQDWLVGANYIPATAVNELEMWQADTFDPERIDLELGWARAIGMNTMRIFLHDLAYSQDPDGFKKRLDQVLTICAKHRIKPMLVIFDSVWDPNPTTGKQRAARQGVHNSGWLQSPGALALQNEAEHPRLEKYVKEVVGAFKNDARVLAWDVWNEPDNPNFPAYFSQEPKNKAELVAKLLPQTFAWARSAAPSQPLTSGVWNGDYSSDDKLNSIQRTQLAESDVISFHSYDAPDEFEKRIRWLERFNRPIICTEYMARGNRNTFVGVLPIMKKYRVGAINWGLVQGKTQTHLPWDSWQKPYVEFEPWIWFHEVFRKNGTPYLREETELIKRLTDRRTTAAKTAAR